MAVTKNQKSLAINPLDVVVFFLRSLIEMTRFTAELERLKKLHVEYGKLRLFCWCAPKRCHAETIKQFLEGV